MPSSALRRALHATTGAAVLGATLIGAPAAHAAEAVPAASEVSCADDATSAPPQTAVVDYASLPGRGFAGKEANAAGAVLRLGTTTQQLRDFVRHATTYDGGVVGTAAGGLIGAGPSRTTVQLVPHSSTRKRAVPANGSLRTNQLNVLRVVGTATVLRGFTLKGTPQGHLYNGLRVERVTGLRADRITVTGIPGNDHIQPGETFAINDYRTTGSRWSHIREDGRGVGASGFGVNSAKDIRICDAVAKNNPAAMGFAFWQSSGITCIDCRAHRNGFAGFNFERTTGTVVLIRPAASGNRYDMRIASDQRSARFRIVDPELRAGRWTISMPRRWYRTNQQRVRDITLVVHGRIRNDLLRIRWY